MFNTDFEMLYQIDSVDANGLAVCDIGGATFGTGDGTNDCPIDVEAEPTVNTYAAVSNQSKILQLQNLTKNIIKSVVTHSKTKLLIQYSLLFRTMLLG